MSNEELTPGQHESMLNQPPQNQTLAQAQATANLPAQVSSAPPAQGLQQAPTQQPQQPTNMHAQPEQFQQMPQQPQQQVVVNNNLGAGGVVGFKGPNHMLHLLLSIFTAGIWLPVWIVIGLRNKQKPIYG